MNITFLIGNGFDRNLGLATTYSEFVKHYKNTEGTSDVLKRFRKDISENEELWSSAEVALGRYTEKFEAGQGGIFAECHIDICEELVQYLKKEQLKVDYDGRGIDIQAVCARLNNIRAPFPTQERNILDAVYSNRRDQPWTYNFICFNYTDTLDRLLVDARKEKESLGVHRYTNTVYPNLIGQVCHVHGTLDRDMVFGVNDETQITKSEVFDCENGDIYKNILIKRSANASYLEGTDGKATKLLNDSHIIYIYGMSLGITDKIWWERICAWLDSPNDRHLIVQKHSMPGKGAFPVRYQIAERKAKQEITNYSSWDEVKRRRIEQRIHITDDNIFEAIKDIGKLSAEETKSEAAPNEESHLVSISVI